MGSGGGAWAAQMQSPLSGCLKAVLLHRPRCTEHNTVRGPPLQTRVVAAYGAVLQLANMLLVVVWNKLLALTENKPPALTDGDPGAHGMEQGKAQRSN